jgi:hypothetical protein
MLAVLLPSIDSLPGVFSGMAPASCVPPGDFNQPEMGAGAPG